MMLLLRELGTDLGICKLTIADSNWLYGIVFCWICSWVRGCLVCSTSWVEEFNASIDFWSFEDKAKTCLLRKLSVFEVGTWYVPFNITLANGSYLRRIYSLLILLLPLLNWWPQLSLTLQEGLSQRPHYPGRISGFWSIRGLTFAN